MANSSSSTTVTRSHSPPLPPNATYHHPSISLTILPSSNRFVAGSQLTGMLEVSCTHHNKVALGQLAIEFFGLEELKLLDHSAQETIHGPHKFLFQGPSLPPSNAVAASQAPIGGHYYTALRGRTKFPFKFPLPSKLPSSTTFQQSGAVRYTLKATCQVLSIKSQQNVLVTATRPIHIVARRPDWSSPASLHEPVEARAEIHGAGGGSGVWAELKCDKRLHWNSHPPPKPGAIEAILTVKNSSRRALSGGVTVKLCRRLVVSQDRNSVEAPTQIVCTTTLRGPEYEFPAVPGQAKTVNLRCPLPAISEADKDQRSSNDAVECFTARGMKLFTIQVFLRVELELGALSEDLVIELPLDVVHPASLPPDALVEPVPATIDHVRSPDPLSIPHLTQTQRPRRSSQASLRSTSPHPVSLQPGGGSRCASPQPDWPNGRSGAPSPAPSTRFSPLPTPRHSPLPSSRFSYPSPFSQNPTYASPTTSRPSHPYCPPTPSWPVPMGPYMTDPPMMNGFPQPPPPTRSPWPEPYPPHQTHPYNPYHDAGPSYFQPPVASPPLANPFSPPATPWCHRPDANSTREHETIHPSHFAPSAPHDYIQTFDHSRTHRHQSMPPTPALSFQSGPPDATFAGSHVVLPSTGPGRCTPCFTEEPMELNRRTSMPMLSQSSHVSEAFRKRALPTPPLGHPSATSSRIEGQLVSPPDSDPPSTAAAESWRVDPFLDTRQRTPLGSRAPPEFTLERRSPAITQDIDLERVSQSLMDYHHIEQSDQRSAAETELLERAIGVSHPARLETIGEAGESRIGTMDAKHISPELLASLSDPSEVISHTRGMKPRRSDESESVQTLEDMAAALDEPLRNSVLPCDVTQPSSAPNGTSEPSNCVAVSSAVAPISAPSVEHRSHSAAKPRLTKSQSAGLANLAGFLHRGNSSSSALTDQMTQSTTGHRQNLSVSSEQHVERPTTPSHTGTAGALRVKSSAISFADAFVDAVPPPSKLAKSVPPSVNPSTSDQASAVSNWVPPPSANPSHLKPDDALQSLSEEENTQTLRRQPAVAPAALFPNFDHRHRHQSLPICVAAEPPIITTQTPMVIKKRSVKKQKSQAKRRSQPILSSTSAGATDASPMIEPDRSLTKTPLPEKPSSSAADKVARWLMHGDSEEAQVVKMLESADCQPRCSALGLELAEATPEEIPTPSLPPRRLPTDQSFHINSPNRHASKSSRPLPDLPATVTPSPIRLSRQPSPAVMTPSIATSPHSEIVVSAPVAVRPVSRHFIDTFQSSTELTPKAVKTVYPSNSGQPSRATEPTSPTRTKPLPEGKPSPLTQMTESPKPSRFDATLPTRALFSAKKTLSGSGPTELRRSHSRIPFPVAASQETGVPASLSCSQIDTTPSSRRHSSFLESPNSSTYSPTTLSRKSRTKRPTSALIGREEMTEAMLVNALAGGWESQTTDHIHQDLIEAMAETNAAVQKATSKRLSTPIFSPPRSMSFSQIRSPGRALRLSGCLPHVGEAEENYDRNEMLSSLLGETAEGVVDEKEIDENVPIPLTAAESRSIRGGRGGRVSSVAAQWARLTRVEDPQPTALSTRAVSITERELDLRRSPMLSLSNKNKSDRVTSAGSFLFRHPTTTVTSSSSEASSRSSTSTAPRRVGRLTDLIKRWEL